MDKKKKHSFKSRLRAFAIWQKLGYLPWQKPKEKKARKRSGDFYKGAFDSIPFLNDDAKRTFSHLLLRPGYMIRDYINGAHERYLAPLTALIVFYAFFALVAAVMQPVQQRHGKEINPVEQMEAEDFENPGQAKTFSLLKNTLATLQKGWVYLHLDQYPEEVDTQHESSLAALEGTLRSQGIPLFAGQFLLLWLAMAWALRRYRMKMSATAAASAYILCQYSFFMLFALLLSFGQSSEVGVLLTMVLLVWDYHQWLGASTKKSIWLAISTGLCAIFLIVVLAFFIGGASFLIARALV
ncbi:MAG: DUF3667 domain-containing protein [Bacteroidales bacterium]|jgi:hypothetical protein|nr:DUF3667 domain-containing protein [Bacteroidales bacterium]